MRGRWWKALGLAGLAGVAATGVVLARNERRRHAYTPEEIRVRLHERYTEVTGPDAPPEPPGPPGAGECPPRRWESLRGRIGRIGPVASRWAARERVRKRTPRP